VIKQEVPTIDPYWLPGKDENGHWEEYILLS